MIGAFILFPLMILLVVFPNDFSDTGLDTTSKQAKKADEETTTQDKLQYGKVYSVEGYRFKINQGYYAKDTDGKNVVIFNIDIALSHTNSMMFLINLLVKLCNCQIQPIRSKNITFLDLII